MGKLSIINGALLFSAATTVIATCGNVGKDDFIDYWDDNACEQNTGGNQEIDKRGACVYTYGRKNVVAVLSDKTREELIKIEKQFLTIGELSHKDKAARDAMLGSGKAIYWYTEKNCPAKSCCILCYSEETNGCKITLANNHGIHIY